MRINSICVYCGSREGYLLEYQMAAIQLGKLLAKNNITLVYGGGHVGLMGIIADSVLQNNGKVIGIIPEILYKRELAHTEITELHVVKNMHERKHKMSDLADAFIAMPGGIGTLEELIEMLTWTQIGIQKVCGILNIADYYKHLLTFFDHMHEHKFLNKEDLALVIEKSPETLLNQLLAYKK